MFQQFVNRRFLLFALIILLVTWVLFVTSQERARTGKIEYFLHTAMVPLENVFSKVGKTTTESWMTISRLAKLKHDNEKLFAENQLLKAKQNGMKLLEIENTVLRAALSFEKKQPHELVAAEIIASNPSNWKHTLTINRGEKDQIEKNMAVISAQGVVGRISDVGSNFAEVILITDPRQGNIIGGMVARNRNMVFIHGGGKKGMCTVEPADDSYIINLKKKDLIFTAENSDIFPRGIPIGRIVQISKATQQVSYQATLKPSVNLAKLQIVYIVRVKKEPKPVVLPTPSAVQSATPDVRANGGGNQ